MGTEALDQEEREGKEEKIVVKSGRGEVTVGEEDWRGLLALCFTLGTFSLAAIELLFAGSTRLLEELIPLNAAIIAFYFGTKSGK